MAIIKCKNCGGDMEISEDKTFGVCEYCGSSMTLPKIDSDQRATAFNRGNHFRRIGEFDKALAVYERIVAEDNTDAEAHWCCALCRFGIEYVEDPATYEWMPTCHRASFDSFLEDVDYLAAVEYSDGITRRQYQKDATKIAEVQRGILATSQKEEPFDVFICYKESDENGQRTVDSTLAQDIYYQLTDKGRRVFFSRITLEDKGGAEYEPYIFAALNSAKVMVVVGTTAENLNAVWVKNEWSRFLSLMKKDHTKLLLPCYRDMDPYDLPEQLSILQSYDMSKIGFIQDLIRGIDKVLNEDKAPEVKKETVVIQGEGGANAAALVKRGNMALEDGEWSKADEFFDRVLDTDAECAEAYLGKELVEAKVPTLDQFREKLLPVMEKIESKQIEVTISGHEEREERLILENVVSSYLEKEDLEKIFVFNFCYDSRLSNYAQQMDSVIHHLEKNKNLDRAEQYADDKLKAEIDSFKNTTRSEMAQTLQAEREKDIQSENDVRERYEQAFSGWEQQINQMHKEAEARRESDYQSAIIFFEKQDYNQALKLFQSVGLAKYKESENYVSQIEKILTEEEKRKKALNREKRRKVTKYGIIVACVAVIVVGLVLVITNVIIPANKYKSAEKMLEEENFVDAAAIFSDLGDYKDAAEKVLNCYYQRAVALLEEGQYEDAVAMFTQADDYSDAEEQILNCYYQRAVALLEEGQYEDAVAMFTQADDYSDAEEQVLNCYYQQAVALLDEGQYGDAAIMYDKAGDYLDAQNRSQEMWINITQRDTISSLDRHTVGLKSDGTVVAIGDNDVDQCNVSSWEDIVAISVGYGHTVGLKSDGTVVATGYNGDSRCAVSSWEDIVAISAGSNHTIGLKSDGTVVAVGRNNYDECAVASWEDIIAISAGNCYTIGLKSDGTVVATGYNGDSQCDVSSWEDIVAISACSSHTIGLKSDGTVVAVGTNDYNQCDVSSWEDIVAISAGGLYTVGLKSDGTVVAVGSNYYGQCDVSSWEDIVAISAGNYYTIGLKSDGTCVAVGYNSEGQCNVSDWSDIRVKE